MKILIVSFYYEPEIGAAPSRITNLAHGLKKSGADVDVLTCLPNYPKGRIFDGYRHRFSCHEVLDGIDVFRYWTYATVSKGIVRRLFAMSSFAFTMGFFGFRIRRIRQYDKVIVQTPPILVPVAATILFKKIYRRNIVLNVSDLWPQSAVELGFMKVGSLSYKITSAMERFIYRNASMVVGQSQEILDHIRDRHPDKPMFLYRNLAAATPIFAHGEARTLDTTRKTRIVYAGLLGVPQDILSVVKSVDFKSLNAELHLYGGGNQVSEIEKTISESDNGVFYHGLLPKDKMNEALNGYDISLIALAKPIKGAVPSKIFDILPYGLPILFCGEGEGANIVEEFGLGLVSAHSDFEGLKSNIGKLTASMDDYHKYSANCLKASEGKFDFNNQMSDFQKFLVS